MGAARGSGSGRAVPPSPQPPGWPGAAVAVPRVTPSGRRRGGRRCDVTARDVSSLTRCDEHASDTAAEAVQSGVPGVSGRSRLRSLPKLLRSAGREGGREGVRPAAAARRGAPAPCHMLLPSSGAPAPAPRINPPEGTEEMRALPNLASRGAGVQPCPSCRASRRCLGVPGGSPQSERSDLARSPPGRCHYLHVTAFYFCLGVMKEVSFPWNLISRLRLSD